MALLLVATSRAAAQPLPPAGPEARFASLPTEADDGQVLLRPALRGPPRWRVLIVPGSGCESLAPSADRLAQGLRQAQVLLLQKPWLSAPGQPCSRAHLQADNLADWQQRALRLAAQGLARTDAQLPLVLVGLSEGAELLPGLVAARPETVALVLVGHAGLDPAEAGALQAQRLGQATAWQQLMAETRGARDDEALLQGRHWRYWQVLQRWPLLSALLADTRPLLQAFGGADALMPASAYQRFADAARRRAGPFCAIRFAQADHQLREAGADRLQQLWRWLDQTAAQGSGTPGPGATISLQDCAAWQAEAAQP
ncbi:MAG: alpha/beta hydrolase [Pseudomonadota bacterium]